MIIRSVYTIVSFICPASEEQIYSTSGGFDSSILSVLSGALWCGLWWRLASSGKFNQQQTSPNYMHTCVHTIIRAITYTTFLVVDRIYARNTSSRLTQRHIANEFIPAHAPPTQRLSIWERFSNYIYTWWWCISAVCSHERHTFRDRASRGVVVEIYCTWTQRAMCATFPLYMRRLILRRLFWFVCLKVFWYSVYERKYMLLMRVCGARVHCFSSPFNIASRAYNDICRVER